MALKATIFKADVQISDMDRHYYEAHALTIAKHPSETDERMMVRLFAFMLFADERLQFTKGLSADEEPELWKKSYSDEIELWVELGQPDERRIRKACGLAQQVVVMTYGGNAADVWWQQIEAKLNRFNNLRVINIPLEYSAPLQGLMKRNMQLQCTIDAGRAWLNEGDVVVEVEAVNLFGG